MHSIPHNTPKYRPKCPNSCTWQPCLHPSNTARIREEAATFSNLPLLLSNVVFLPLLFPSPHIDLLAILHLFLSPLPYPPLLHSDPRGINLRLGMWNAHLCRRRRRRRWKGQPRYLSHPQPSLPRTRVICSTAKRNFGAKKKHGVFPNLNSTKKILKRKKKAPNFPECEKKPELK